MHFRDQRARRADPSWRMGRHSYRNPSSFLSPDSQKSKLPKHTDAELPNTLPTDSFGSLLDCIAIADQQDRPSFGPKYTMVFVNHSAVKWTNLLRPAQLFSERR